MLTSWVQILRREFRAEELEKLSAFIVVIEVRRPGQCDGQTDRDEQMSGMSSEAEVLRKLVGDNVSARSSAAWRFS